MSKKKSFLKGVILPVKSRRAYDKNNCKFGEKTGEEALVDAIEEILNNYKCNEDKFKIHSESGEGIFFSQKDRVCYEKNEDGFFIGRNSQMLDEPAFSRAIFNNKVVNIEGEDACLIAYEAPLLAGGTEAASCDLIAHKKDTIYAVEYKRYKNPRRYKDPWSDVTDIQYGLVESLIYGIILSKHLKNFPDKVWEQTKKAYHEYHNINPPIEKPIKVSFMLCAPQKYFNIPVNNEESMKCAEEMQCLVTEYLKENGPGNLSFGGYSVFGEGDENLYSEPVQYGGKEINGKKWFVPSFDKPIKNYYHEKDIATLWSSQGRH